MTRALDRSATAAESNHRDRGRCAALTSCAGTTLALLMLLGGCASQPAPPPGEGAGAVREVTVVHPGDAVVSVVGTPFLLAFKGVICAATVVVAAPASALAAMSESRFSPEIQSSLGDGIAQNCGPPYVLSPYRVVQVVPEAELERDPRLGLDPQADIAPEREPQPLPGAPVPLVPD